MEKVQAGLQKVGRQSLHRPVVCWEKMLVGKERFVGKIDIGQENLDRSVRQLVGKSMLVGKGLCQSDLR
jgi:hypothetical protein